MLNQDKDILLTGTLLLFLAVLLGAFGAHGLETSLSPKAIMTFKTGVQYHYYHAFGLIILALIQKTYNFSVQKSALLFSLGIFLFSVNCYLYAITQIKTFAMIVPFGGVAFILGWLILAIKVYKELK